MRRRLVLAVVGLVALILFVHDVPLRSHLQRVEKDRVVTALERDASTLAAKAQQLLVENDPANSATPAGTTLARLVEDYATHGTALVLIVDADGAAQAATDSTVQVGSSYLNRPEIASALLGNSVVGERRSVTLGQDLVYSAVPVLTADRVIGAVRLTYPKSVVDGRVARRLRGLALLAMISLVLAFFSSFVIATSVVRPLRNLRRKSDDIASGNLAARAEIVGPVEIRELAKSFNEMAERVEAMLAEQRGFAADASHQLRTPLTALRLRVEQALATVTENPNAANESIAEDLEAAANELDRLSRLVEQLLALARTEAPKNLVSVSLAEVIEGRRALWVPLAEERGVDFVCGPIPEGLAIDATPEALEQILDNYIDNALDYAPEGTTIRIDVTRANDEVSISVTDNGSGMSTESRERAFDRFWRGAESQNRPSGSGLGLSIVAQLAAASGGRVALRENPEGGLVAVVVLRASQLRRHDDNSSL